MNESDIANTLKACHQRGTDSQISTTIVEDYEIHFSACCLAFEQLQNDFAVAVKAQTMYPLLSSDQRKPLTDR